MDLNLKDNLYLVTGATSGFGNAIALSLISEGAHVIANARTEEKLHALQQQYPDQVELVAGDISKEQVHVAVLEAIGSRKLHGALVNAGGPPAKSFAETTIDDWDTAYQNVLRWKVQLTDRLVKVMLPNKYGRIVFIESISVKQPIENLVLSNAFRLGVIGFVKTLSQEIARSGITLNVLAPGYHATPAMERLFAKRASLLGIDPDEAKREFEQEVKMGHLGNPEDLAALATWLLSAGSGYVTGQTISVDGGLALGIF